MKNSFIIFGALIFIASCGEDIPRGDGGPNKEVETMIGKLKVLDEDEKLSREEADLLLSACSALERKKQTLESFVGLRRSLTFKKTFKGCGDESASDPETYETKITYNGSSYNFDENSPFAYVVTDESFSMGDVCVHVMKAAESSESPALPSRKVAVAGASDPVWVSAFGRGSFQCENEKDIVCVYIETGAATANESRYRVRNVKSYTIIGKRDDPERGFLSGRLEASMCDDKSYQYTSSELVSSGL